LKDVVIKHVEIVGAGPAKPATPAHKATPKSAPKKSTSTK
jgi:hypothetical protein